MLEVNFSTTWYDHLLTRYKVERTTRDIALALLAALMAVFTASRMRFPVRAKPHAVPSPDNNFRLMDGTFDGYDPDDVLHHIRNRRLVRIDTAVALKASASS